MSLPKFHPPDFMAPVVDVELILGTKIISGVWPQVCRVHVKFFKALTSTGRPLATDETEALERHSPVCRDAPPSCGRKSRVQRGTWDHGDGQGFKIQ